MSSAVRILVFSLLATILSACAKKEEQAAVVDEPEPAVVEIVARGLTFEMPSRINAGWNTFRFRNESPMVHFAVLEKMPAGKGLVEQQEQVAPIFQDGMDKLNEGDVDGAMAEFAKLPAWFHEIEFMGGPGLVAPGHTAETTVFLEPGSYLVECYVKTGGIFHSFNPSPDAYGMVYQFEVSDTLSAGEAPSADIEIKVSGESGFTVTGSPVAGKQVVAVTFEDQKVHENFVQHDLHLVRLEDDTRLETLSAWMDWSSPTGLESPAPATFIGGSNEMPAGSTAFLHLDLRPGRYAWIAEVPNPAGKGLLLEFTVAGAD